MSKLLLTDAKGKQRAARLVPIASSQQPNEVQTRELVQVNKRLSPEILGELAKRGLAIMPSEISKLLSRLKSHAELTISIAD